MADIRALESRYLFQTYRRQPLVLERGQGSFVWDTDGKRYLDFFSGLGVNNLGHTHPSVVRAIAAQSRKLLHTSNLYYTVPQTECARELVRRSFPGKVFFSNSGAEANECAIKLARRWGGRSRPEIIAFENSFHGRTLATLSLTGQTKFQKGFEPLISKVVYAKFNDMDSVIQRITDRTAAVFIEPVQGEGGIFPATLLFLRKLRGLCTSRRLLLVFDEVQCGMGRTGRLFAFQHYGVTPDVVTLAKGLGGGLPIGATVARDQVAELFGRGDHASTFGGNPVACAAAVQVLKTMDAKLLASVRKKSRAMLRLLNRMRDKFPNLICQVRGIGMMFGVELVEPADGAVTFCRERGLLINVTQEKVIRLLPPLNVSAQDIETALTVLDQYFRACSVPTPSITDLVK